MVKRLLQLVAALVATVFRSSVVLEIAGVAALAVWAGQTWGARAVFLVVGVALLAKSLEADSVAPVGDD